ncbi:MAG: NUDIX domain-containing protein [Clostridia bacterium]|nr:NUDIX domain-containing protein [Clostridia bacterium]
METFIINPDNLVDSDIDEVVVRVKNFIINNNREVLVAFSNNGVQLPGGHVEVGENFESAIRREILEEAGIALDNKDTISECFFVTKYYKKNYHGLGHNRLTQINYYVIHSDKQPDIRKVSLTDTEKQHHLNVKFLTFGEFENTTKNVFENAEDEGNRVIAGEMLRAWNELKCGNVE